jgi:phytanoyl-CoA hydroxylase
MSIDQFFAEKLHRQKTRLDMADMQPLEVKKGACVVLDGYLPHYSQPNTSGRSRQAYAVHLVNPLAHYPADNWLRREHSTLRVL